ncbi:MAG TPA: hypothetical protein VM187_03510, partial [Niastella sp.]|nr:hypothetical protein [Niastella sp.]
MTYKLSRLAVALTILGMIVFYACRKNDLSSSSPKNSDITDASVPMSVSLAKRYYKVLKHEQGTEVRLPHGARSAGSEVNTKHPLWQKVYTGETKLHTFVEVPLFYNKRPSAIINTGDEQLDMTTVQQVLNTSFDRLIIYKNKKTGTVDQRIVTYIPDAKYAQAHAKDMSNNQLLHLDAFSGYLLFRKWDGTMLSGSKLENGKVTQRLKNITKKSKTPGSAAAAAARMICTTYCVQEYTETCYHSTSGEYTQEWCDWSYSGTYCWESCYDDGTGEGGGTGDPCIDYGDCGGGGPTNPTNDPDCVPAAEQLSEL